MDLSFIVDLTQKLYDTTQSALGLGAAFNQGDFPLMWCLWGITLFVIIALAIKMVLTII